ncbi:phage tail assembly protein [Roseovarius sp. D0-M9]|uniref:phage tail assembly protein n=1 Tax=Roseovarius sp. D0-M9 TaxID=3127117 RepID=UPI00300FAB2D
MSDNKAPGYPAYIKEGADCSLTVELSRGVDIAGAHVTSIKLREPSLDDQLVSQKIGNNAEAEVALIANLAEVAPEELRGVKMRDFIRLQEALGFFYD